MTLPGLSLPLQQLLGADAEHVAQDLQRLKIDAGGPSLCLNEAVGIRHGDAPVAGLGELVGGFQRGLVGRHEFGESDSHVTHVTNVIPDGNIGNSGITYCGIAGYGYIQGVLYWSPK